MAFQTHDNVRETFTGAGSATITLGGAAGTSRAFSSKYSNGDTFWGTAHAIASGDISVGKFTYNVTTVTQTEVKYSSNGDAAVSFPLGATCEIYNDVPAFIFDHLNLVEEVLASAATTDLGSIKGLCIELQGTTNPSSFGTFKNKQRIVRYTGAGLTITNSSTLVCLGAANLTLATGDIFYVVSDNTSTPIWRIMWRRPAASRELQSVNNLSDVASAATARTNLGLGNLDNTSDVTKNGYVRDNPRILSITATGTINVNLSGVDVVVCSSSSTTTIDTWTNVVAYKEYIFFFQNSFTKFTQNNTYLDGGAGSALLSAIPLNNITSFIGGNTTSMRQSRKMLLAS